MNLNNFLSKIYVFIFSFFPSNFNIFISKLFKKLFDLNLESGYAKDFLANLDIQGVKFSLLLMGGDKQAQSVYRPLHNKKKTYEIILIKLLMNIIDKKKYRNFLDIGSFMGYYSCFLSKYSNSINVSSIESNSKYIGYIKNSLKINNLTNVNVFNEILSDKVEDMYFYKEGVYKEQNKKLNYEHKKSKTLDDLCSENNIKPEVIKIDVHGAERKVFKGGEKILKEKTKIILLELHSDEYIKKFSDSGSRKSVIENLNSLGFNCYLVSSFRETDKKQLENKGFEKFKIKKIDDHNYENLFYNRSNLDELILALKEDIDLENLGCAI